MSPDKIHLGATPFPNLLGISSLEGPHLDNDGNVFEPKRMFLHSLHDLIHNRHESDLYFTCYSIAGLEDTGWPRIRKVCLQSLRDNGLELGIPVIAFDWDCPDHNPWTDEYVEQFFGAFNSMEDGHLNSWRYMYTSAHGARVVYVLDKPATPHDAEGYIVGMMLKFKEAGITMDANCKDWTRLFRLPNVVRDGAPTWDEPYYYFEEQEAVLDTSTLKKVSQLILPTLKRTDAGRRGVPTSEEVFDILNAIGANSRPIQSSFYKDAKAALEKRKVECFDALFKPDITIAGPGERNDVIMRSLGQVIPILMRAVRYLKPEHVFALYHGPLLATEIKGNEEEWLWNAILTIWRNEALKFNEEETERSDREERALTEKETMAEGMKKWCLAKELETEQAVPYVERHLLANFGKFFYPMRPDGFYDRDCVTSEQLITRIRTSHLNNIVNTYEIGSGGKMQSVTDKTIRDNHATIVQDIIMIPQMPMDGHIEGLDSSHPVLKIPMYRRNPNLKPEYIEEVDMWMVLLFGLQYKKATEILGSFLDFEGGPTCALSLETAPGIGKHLLIEGLKECLERPALATGNAFAGVDNEILGKTPFLHINEAWPKNPKESLLEMFKKLVDGSQIQVEGKFKPKVEVYNPLRILMTANNAGLVEAMIDKHMKTHDREAVGERLTHIKLSNQAREHLEQLGGRRFTGRLGHRWIAGTDGKSDYLVARHLLFLWEEWVKVRDRKRGTRFLVEGNMGVHNESLMDMTMNKESTSIVAKALLQMLEAKSKGPTQKFIADECGRLWVTISCVSEALQRMEPPAPMSFTQLFPIITDLAISQDPITLNEKEYHEIDTDTLLRLARRAGIDAPELRKLVMLRQKTMEKESR